MTSQSDIPKSTQTPDCNCASHGLVEESRHGGACPYGLRLRTEASAPISTSDDLLLCTGRQVGGEWEIKVCPLCAAQAEHLGSGRWGCGRHITTVNASEFRSVRVVPSSTQEANDAG
jgi:hypothetical protein